ncbi:Uncharacterised protein [Escherichia coli]|nr:Uncharacterised protein [Escherichia coli]
MIHLFKTCMITAFILGLTWSAPTPGTGSTLHQYTQYRYDMAPGNICAYQFRLDNAETMKDLAPSPSLCNSKTNMVRRCDQKNGNGSFW